MAAAARELHEECNLSPSDVLFAAAPFTVTDVIRPAPNTDGAGSSFHYMLAQTFCRTNDELEPSKLSAGDDAGDARWYDLQGLKDLDAREALSPGVIPVVQRGLMLYERGLLPLGDDELAT